MDLRLAATTAARIARMAAAAAMKAVARIGEVMVISFLLDRTLRDRGCAMEQPGNQFPLLLWQRHQDLSLMTKL